MPGYSGTPLAKKLGIKPGMTACFVNEPDEFGDEVGPLDDVKKVGANVRELDYAMIFCTKRAELEKRFASLAARLKPTGMLWVSWPKKTSGVPSDLNENIVREIGLEAGLVDTKVCAVTEVWSGLKFMYRLKDRPKD